MLSQLRIRFFHINIVVFILAITDILATPAPAPVQKAPPPSVSLPEAVPGKPVNPSPDKLKPQPASTKKLVANNFFGGSSKDTIPCQSAAQGLTQDSIIHCCSYFKSLELPVDDLVVQLGFNCKVVTRDDLLRGAKSATKLKGICYAQRVPLPTGFEDVGLACCEKMIDGKERFCDPFKNEDKTGMTVTMKIKVTGLKLSMGSR